MTRSHHDTYTAFIAGTLAADEWTHEAHLVACWMTLQDRDVEPAIDFLRQAIKTHNCGVGTPNTETEGYHESITVYYVHAVAAANTDSPEDLFDRPDCGRQSALSYWSRDLLFSVAARTGWVAPDLQPFPFSVAADR